MANGESGDAGGAEREGESSAVEERADQEDSHAAADGAPADTEGTSDAVAPGEPSAEAAPAGAAECEESADASLAVAAADGERDQAAAPDAAEPSVVCNGHAGKGPEAALAADEGTRAGESADANGQLA